MAELQEQRTKNSIQLLYALGWIVPWTLIASIGNGLLVPLSQFVGLNFFAQRYTDLPPSEIHCELGVGPQYCQMALVDGNRFVTALSVLMPVCQFLTLPLVGVLSDAYGRKRALIIVYALANFALLFADLFLFFNVSFWFAMAVQPFMNAQVVTTVLNSSCVDILDKQDRAAGMGLITALDTVAYVTGLLIGIHLQMQQTYLLASCSNGAALVYLFFLFPETLPREKRSFNHLSLRSFLPWDSLPILWRTTTLRNLSIVTAIAGFIDNSTARMIGVYYQRTMAWTAQDSYALETYWDLSMIVWMTFIFSLVVSYSGEVGAMAFGRFMGLCYILFAVGVKHPQQAFANAAVCAGPMAFALPAVAGLKSRLVGEDEQGRMQAAISTVFTVSGSLGMLVGGGFFEAYGNVDYTGKFSHMDLLSKMMILLNLCGAGVSAYFFCDLFQRTRHFITDMRWKTDNTLEEGKETLTTPETNYGTVQESSIDN